MSSPTNPLNTSHPIQNKEHHPSPDNPDTDPDNLNHDTKTQSKDNDTDLQTTQSTPKTKRCPHVNNIKKKIKPFKFAQCEKCHGNAAEDDRLVFCLTCFKMNCARDTQHMHGLNHWIGNKKHNLCISIPSFDEFNNYTKDIILDMLSIWCYKCDCFLHETEQDNTPKLRKIKYEIYGCLQRSYKKLTNKKKQIIHSSKNNSPQNKSKKGDKYSQFKNRYNQNQQQRSKSSYNDISYKGDNVSPRGIKKWSNVEPHFMTKMHNDKDNGYIGCFGLQNLGNTCFFNSILQNLSETRPLICALTESQDVIRYNARRIQMKDEKDAQKQQSKENKKKYQRNRSKYSRKQEQQNAMDKKLRGRLLTEFHHVITDAYAAVDKSRGYVVPSGLLNAVVARNRRFAGRRQQDSHELMRVLVEGMRDQNEKMLKRDRKNRLQRNLSNWTMNDVMEWFAFYDVDFKQSVTYGNDDGDIKLDITVQDFSDFIKKEHAKELTSLFFSKIGLNEEEDTSLIKRFERGRVLLVNEECDFYCKKHRYDLVPQNLKHNTKREKHDKNSNIHDNKQKEVNKINTIIDDVFGGSIQSMVTCYGCGNVSRTTEEFFDLSLPISNPKLSGYGRRGYGGNAWLTSRKGKKQKKWNNNKTKHQQNKKNKGKKRNEANKEDIELADNVAVSIDISKADQHEDNTEDTEITDKPMIVTDKYIPSELPSIRGMDRLKGNVDLLDCLAAFTDPELLNGSDKYGCKYCTRNALEKLKEDNAKWNTISTKYSSKNVEEKEEDTDSNEEKGESPSEDNDTDDDEESKTEDEVYVGDEIEQIISNGYPLKKHDATKQILIHKPPQVLVLHLKRFEQQGYRLSKVGKKVRFPLQLDIDPYLTQEYREEHSNDNEIDRKCMYQLYGMSVHHGSMGGGHYIAYTHKHRNDGPKNGWYYFSDSSYRAVSFEDALKAEAYVLFYQKCDYNDQDNDDDDDDVDNDDDDDDDVDNDKQ